MESYVRIEDCSSSQYQLNEMISATKESTVTSSSSATTFKVIPQLQIKPLSIAKLSVIVRVHVPFAEEPSKSEKLPSQIFINLVRLLSFSIDFQRDIQSETKFEILYEKFYDYNDILLKVGNILYSKVSLKKKNEIEMFYYEIEKSKGEYFNAEGKSIRKTLMRTPIDGARISSGFGKRRHPILGYNKMHKGLDFAAKYSLVLQI